MYFFENVPLVGDLIEIEEFEIESLYLYLSSGFYSLLSLLRYLVGRRSMVVKLVRYVGGNLSRGWNTSF